MLGFIFVPLALLAARQAVVVVVAAAAVFVTLTLYRDRGCGRRTGSSNPEAEEYPRKKIEQQYVYSKYQYIAPGVNTSTGEAAVAALNVRHTT